MGYAEVASVCGHPAAYMADSLPRLQVLLADIRAGHALASLGVKVRIGSRQGLGRPVGTAAENKINFMEYLKGQR